MVNYNRRSISKLEFFLYIVLCFVGLHRVILNEGIKSSAAVSRIENNTPKIAIIIDDFGNNAKGTNEMLSLDIKFTGAVMPDMERSSLEAELLVENNKAVIIHQPMEPHSGKKSWLGKNPILKGLSIDETKERFISSIESVPYADGFNNHMGSLITEDREKMTTLLKIAKDNHLFFVDSLTTDKSVGEELCRELGIKYIKRDVFLDSTHDKELIKSNLLKTADIALEKGYAVCIGHVGAEGGVVTADAINECKAEIESKGIEFVYVRDLLK